MVLSTARLQLRPFLAEDREGYAELLSNPETHPFVVEGGPVPAEEVPARIEGILQSTTSTFWALEFEGEFVGYVALHGGDSPAPALSYAVRGAWRRQGLALEALGAVCGAHPDKELVARTHAENVASAALLERSGFREHGTVQTEHGPRREFRRGPVVAALRQVSALRSGSVLLGFVVVCFTAAALGAFFPPDAWYEALNKPSWNPPGWVFGPVWTVLYLGMASAAWRIWCRPPATGLLLLFGVQLILNAVWSPLFFGLHALGLALAEILVLLVALTTTGVCFYRRDRIAGLLFVPYFVWVSFASVLTATLWHLNPG